MNLYDFCIDKWESRCYSIYRKITITSYRYNNNEEGVYMEYTVTNSQELQEMLQRCHAAQAKFATYTQEQVDKIFLAAATAANKARIYLAKMAVAETGMGVVEDKVIKNHYASEYIYNAYKHEKTCGVLEEDPSYGVMKIAEPIGVIGAVIPLPIPPPRLSLRP